METQIWTKYATDEVNDKIKYWVDLWEDLIDNFGQNPYGLDLISPHVLLRLVVDEVDDHELRNEQMRQLFLARLSEAAKSDVVLIESLSPELSLILSQLNTSNLYYLVRACENTLSFFESGRYFHDSHSKLVRILSQVAWNAGDENTIRTITNNLIVELLLKGIPAAAYVFLPKREQSETEEKITQCLHWYRKAAEGDNLEDQLLNYWIVTEKLFGFSESDKNLLSPTKTRESKIDRINELIPSAFGLRYIYDLSPCD
jgi:hypothetical protein